MIPEVNHGERAHALLSASGSERWINCPASPRLEEQFPEEKASVYADEGTLAHEMSEIMLKVDLKLMPMDQYRKEIAVLKRHVLYTHAMDEPVMEYVNYVKQQYAEAKRIDSKAKIFIEHKFSMEKYVQDGFGTSDNAIAFAQQLEIIDLKFGKGKEVKAEHNTQLKYYALGVLESLGKAGEAIQMVKLTIVQPRMSNISSWSIPAKFLRKWGEDVLKPKAIEAYRGDGEQKAGDWCQYCKARAKCRALHEMGMQIVRRDFEEHVNPKLVNDEELFAMYKNADFITKFLADVKDVVLKEAIAGKKWPGHKLVEGKSNRQWTDETQVSQILKENLYEPEEYQNVKLKGLGDLESLLRKANFEKLLGHLIVKPPGAPTLVDENDKREEFGVSQLHKDFADITIDDEDFDLD